MFQYKSNPCSSRKLVSSRKIGKVKLNIENSNIPPMSLGHSWSYLSSISAIVCLCYAVREPQTITITRTVSIPPLQIRKLILRVFISARFSLDFPELPSPPIPSSPGCLEGICFMLCLYSGFVPFGSLLSPQGLEQGLAQSRPQELFVEWMDKSSLRF